VTAVDELRGLMRRLPAGVAVLTVDTGRERVGLTVSSLLSLSLHPPLVGVSIAREAALHELLRDAGGFAVSLLAGGQEGLAQHFARGVPPIGMWEGVETEPDGEGPPLLSGALGWLECRLVDEHATGDHTLFVGEVESVRPGTSGPPLVHHAGGYRSL
jgi:flavin reductase (DIM6/NTAB) family NADH-FMN oxidoreductase RutF